jgi:hypothetical protein
MTFSNVLQRDMMTVFKNVFPIILFLVGFTDIGYCLSDDNNDENGTNEYFMHQKNYIPGQPLNTAVKTIYVAVNIWQEDDGSGNFSESDLIIDHLNYIFWAINMFFAQSAMPSNPIEGIEYLEDSNIRFELKEVSWYRNSDLFGVDCGAGQRLNTYVFAKSPHKRQYLNIHFNTGSCIGATGYANYPSGRNLEADSFVVTFIKHDPDDEENYPFWPLKKHIMHEIGHNLELRHPYDSEYCRFDHPDFLFDLFGFERQDWCTNPRSNCDICYHQGGWTCDYDNPRTTCTTNLMGGNRTLRNITPLQMGRMNRALATRSVRKYAWGYSDIPYEVTDDQVWAFNKKFYQDIIVRSGVTLRLTGTLEMVPQAKIIIEPGGELIVDNGTITSALYSPGPWQGIEEETAPRRFFDFLRKNVPPVNLQLLMMAEY